jgi:hypothetical protein
VKKFHDFFKKFHDFFKKSEGSLPCPQNPTAIILLLVIISPPE